MTKNQRWINLLSGPINKGDDHERKPWTKLERYREFQPHQCAGLDRRNRVFILALDKDFWVNNMDTYPIPKHEVFIRNH